MSEFHSIKTNRLVARRLHPDDARELFELRTNPDVNKFLDREPPATIEDVLKFISTINEKIDQDKSMYWAIQFNDNQKLIGTACLFNYSDENNSAEFGYELSPAYQGKGIMQEIATEIINYAFNIRGFTLLEAIVNPANQPSIKLLKKFNFGETESNVENHLRFMLANQTREKAVSG